MHYFENLIIQNKIKSFFKKVIQNDHLAHAYLFHGNKGTGKVAFALELAKTLNCINPENKPCGECPACLKISNCGEFEPANWGGPLPGYQLKAHQSPVLNLLLSHSSNPPPLTIFRLPFIIIRYSDENPEILWKDLVEYKSFGKI